MADCQGLSRVKWFEEMGQRVGFHFNYFSKAYGLDGLYKGIVVSIQSPQ
jgi:hypothetical protein